MKLIQQFLQMQAVQIVAPASQPSVLETIRLVHEEHLEHLSVFAQMLSHSHKEQE
jgi:hypothetical protein